MKEICTTSKKINNINAINTDYGEKIEDIQTITNTFNNKYIETGLNLANKIKLNPDYKPTKQTVVNSIFLKPTSLTEVCEIMSSLKIHKAAGIDGLQAETLKSILSSAISSPLACIINISMEIGYSVPLLLSLL